MDKLANRHSSRDLDIGSEFHDLWLDSLIEVARKSDPEFCFGVAKAWEAVMMVGIDHLLSRLLVSFIITFRKHSVGWQHFTSEAAPGIYRASPASLEPLLCAGR